MSTPATHSEPQSARFAAPQATLQGIRAVVDACALGDSTSRDVRARTGFSSRRVAYALNAAKMLGLILDTGTGLSLSAVGVELSRTASGSEREAKVLAKCITCTQLVQAVAPGLLSANPPHVAEVARRMRERGALSQNTATHRARMLLEWRDVLMNRRLDFAREKREGQRGHMPVLHVRNFAQIEDARIEFGDLTVLVGPQATGKSLVLQWFKAALDMGEIFSALKEAGHDVRTSTGLIDLVFGEGMSAAWTQSSSVQLDSKSVSPSTWTKGQRKRDGKVFYIPAHRALLLSEGWPAPFIKLNADTPVVARLFSQNLYQRFSGRQAAALFPVSRILKEQYRLQIDEAVFHGGRVELQKEGLRYRLQLAYADTHLPFMTWTAGQREFTPLLLGLYQVLPPRKVKKVKDIDWVVIEEPEMGLHPQAIAVFMLLVLDLLWRGYRVVVSTHSPLILDSVWAIRQLREHNARWQLLSQAFGVGQPRSVQSVMEHALQCDYRVFFMYYDQDVVRSQDISGLDPGSHETAEAEWGGLTGFSSRFAEAVRIAVTEYELRHAS